LEEINMKKALLFALTLVLSMSLLVGCGDSAPDLTEVNNKYNQAVDIFNEAATIVTENGMDQDPDFLAVHNGLADEIENIRLLLEDPEQSKNIDVETTSADLDELIFALEDYRDAVAGI